MAASKKKNNKDAANLRYPEAARHTMSELQQVRALADPLRLRLLAAFGQERTTKQVAELIGERPTRLYHHVEALEKVGLIRLSRTRQNRGTLEKYFLAVARSFQVDSGMFGKEETRAEGEQSMQSVLAAVFDETKGELQELLAKADLENLLEEEGILSYVEIHASEEFVGKLQKRIKRLLRDLQKECSGVEETDKKKSGAGAGKETAPDRRYRLTLAFYPLDR